MATEPPDKLLDEFIAAWNAAERPRADDYVRRAAQSERDELAGLIGAFLEIAPTPDFSPDQLAEIRREPAVEDVIALAGPPRPWKELLPRLRKRARLKRDQVVDRLAELLGVAGREDKVKLYYHGMETGTLDPAGVSRRVLDALAGILGVGVGELERSGELGFESPAGAPAYLRADTDTLHTEPSGTRAAPPAPIDDIDELFRGGR